MILHRSCALLILSCVLPAQDPGAEAAGREPVQVSSGEDEGPTETALERAQRDQVRVGLRLESLRQKMERLAQRYEDEGRARNAELLRGAMTRFDEDQLLDVSRELQRNLEQSNLSTVEQQDSLVASLEEIQALLRDRRDMDELSRQSDLARQGLSELSNLAENERRLLSATRAATDRPEQLLEQSLDLAERLARLAEDASRAAEAAERADAALGEAALADQIARRQRDLAAEPEPTAAEQSLLEKALAMLRERLAQPLEGGALGQEVLEAAESARDDARTRAAEAAKRMAAARAALERHAPETLAGRAEGTPPDGEASGDDPAAAEPSGSEPSGSEPSGSEPSGSEPSGSEPSGSEPSGSEPSGSEPSGGEPGSEPADESTQPGASEATGEPGGSEAEGDATPADGAEAGTVTPEEEPPADALEAARAEMEAAAEALEETRDALDRSERTLAAARNRASALAMASSADARRGGDELEELAERLEAVEPEQGEELLDRTRALLDELAALAEDAEAGDMAAAASAGESAQMSLGELIEMLKQRTAGSATGEGEAPGEPDAAVMQDLAERQAELERRTRELMQRLADLPDQGFQEPAERASQAMGGAQDALRSGQTDEATVREKEAAEQLEEARKTLAGEAERYEQLRQEEVLFRVGEELDLLHERQTAISTETGEIDTARGDSDRLGRSQRRAVSRLSNEERDLSERTESLRTTLEEDGSLAFTFALERCRDDMLAVAEFMSDEQTGYMVQTTQADIVMRLADLIAVLEEELERRRDADIEEPSEEGSQGEMMGEPRPQLIPTVAELLLMQRMEQAALARLENFIRLNPEIADEARYGDIERLLLERWSLEHIKVTSLFEKMVQSAGPGAGAAPPVEVQPEDEP